MTSELLSCSICPKLPKFSDVSHLLTHVGSKGHLAHLHKLQIRSHQEIAAAVQLTSYNQWYQQHGLGLLLSERLLQKEAKLAIKRNSGIRQGASLKRGRSLANRSGRGQVSSPRRSARSRIEPAFYGVEKPKSESVYQTRHTGDSDPDYTPQKRSRRCSKRIQSLSPLKRPSSCNTPRPRGQRSNGSNADIDPSILPTPDEHKLKGIVWPGMDRFDAATADMKRKRNQKKDGTVLKLMERLSSLVQPMETVYSPGGSWKKARHMDDLEDNSSLIDGESPRIKRSASRKRPALRKISGNVPRLNKRKSPVRVPKSRHRTIKKEKTVELMNEQSSADENNTYPYAEISPTRQDYIDLKPDMNDFVGKKREGFAIFNDHDMHYMSGMLSDEAEGRSSYPKELGPTRPQLLFTSAPWLRPASQQSLNYHGDYAPTKPANQSALRDTSIGKENILPILGRLKQSESQNANPLFWKSDFADQHPVTFHSDSIFNGYAESVSITGDIEDPFTYTKNPLAQVLAHLQDELDEDIPGDNDPPFRDLFSDRDTEINSPDIFTGRL